MGAVIVGNALARNLSLFNTKEFTPEKGLMNAVSVGNSLPAKPTSFDTGQFTLEQSLMGALNVDLLARALASFDIEELTCSERVKLFNYQSDLSQYQRVHSRERP